MKGKNSWSGSGRIVRKRQRICRPINWYSQICPSGTSPDSRKKLSRSCLKGSRTSSEDENDLPWKDKGVNICPIANSLCGTSLICVEVQRCPAQHVGLGSNQDWKAVLPYLNIFASLRTQSYQRLVAPWSMIAQATPSRNSGILKVCRPVRWSLIWNNGHQ